MQRLSVKNITINLILVVLCFILSINSFGQKATILGNVGNETSDGVLSDVVVSLSGKSTRTNVNGYYEFSGVQFGKYDIVFELRGYEVFTKTINVDREYFDLGMINLSKKGVAVVPDSVRNVSEQDAVEKESKKNVRDDADNAVLEDVIEQISTSSETESLDATSLTDDLEQFKISPLNLNDATEIELQKFIFLTDFEIKSILFYLKKSGPMYTPYELQMVYGLPMDKIQMMLPFITVAPKATTGQFPLKKAFTRGKHQLLTRVERIIEQQAGYSAVDDAYFIDHPNSRYLGDPYRIYTKYKYNYRNKLYWGITMEKDAGENFFNLTDKYKKLNDAELNRKMTEAKGFDYYSAHFQINDIKLYKDILSFRTICLGDYELQFGQGLTMWSGLSSGKSSEVMGIYKRPYGLKRYGSTNENQFMRGAATVFRVKNIDITGFYSYKNIDANVTVGDSTDLEETMGISSLQITGIHTTAGEVKDRKTVSENVFGGDVTYNTDYFKLGLTFVNYSFGMPLSPSYIRPYNQFEFTGKDNYNAGINYQFVLKDMRFFGEGAISKNGKYSTVHGMTVKMATQVAFGVLYRDYEKGYQSYYGKAFSESGALANERGLYMGAEVYPHKKFKLSGFYDMYWFPWLRSSANAPTTGVDYFFETNYYHSSRVTMSARFRQETKPSNVGEEVNNVKELGNVDSRKLRFQIVYSIYNNLKLKNRIDLIQVKKGTQETSNGYMVYQDIFYTLPKTPLSLTMRFGVFDTDNFTSAIYSYETDVLYSYSVPAFYDKGVRAYLMAKYTLFKGLDFWFRIGQTHFTNKTSISSGLAEISGKNKTDVTFQVRYKF